MTQLSTPEELFTPAPPRDDSVVWGAFATIGVIGILFAVFGMSAETFIFVCVLSFIVAMAARVLLRNDTTDWLGKLVFYGWLAKLIGSAAREWVAIVAYRGAADAVGYYQQGAFFHVHTWRSFNVPVVTGRGFGTNFTESITGLLFVPYVPDIKGGFMLFATIAFIGQMLFYSAFRTALPEAGHKRYAWAIFLLPTMVYWPSSIGKDSLIVFGLGLASWGAASMFAGRWGTGIIATVAGLMLTAAIRPHVAALFFGAATVSLLIGRAPSIRGGQFIRIVLLVVMGVGLAFAAVRLSAAYNVGLSGTDLEGFSEQVQEQTSQGGSQVSGEPVSNLADIPEASLRVLFRPLLHEANNVQTLASAVEGTVLFGITILALPRIVSNLWAGRRHQFVGLALAYTFGFVIAFSSFFNLGIIARQRVQVMPLLMVWIVALTLRREELFPPDDVEPVVVQERVGSSR